MELDNIFALKNRKPPSFRKNKLTRQKPNLYNQKQELE